MRYVDQATAAIHEAERQIRRALEAAVHVGEYSQVRRIAEIAQALRQLVDKSSSDAATSLPEEPKSRSTQATYPRFEIDGDRLVKVGWSKREKAPYEHKATRAVCEEVFEHLAGAQQGHTFRMDDLLPVTMDDGTEIPSYQSYLVLAWLRSIQKVEKVGKDGYRWTGRASDSFDEAWESTPRRQPRGK